jgi:uncharacterized protein
MVPDRAKALQLHKELGSTPEIIEHCEAVARVANEISEKFEAKGLPVDKEAVYAAALLHDIGRTRTHGVQHGYVGAELLKERGVDESVTRIVMRHVGAGISKEEAEKFGFPVGDYIPKTLEERIVCFSDKVVGPQGKVVSFSLEIEKFRRKGLDVDRLENLKKSLEKDLGEDPESSLT